VIIENHADIKADNLELISLGNTEDIVTGEVSNIVRSECMKIKVNIGATATVHIDAVELPVYPGEPLTLIAGLKGFKLHVTWAV
jgi:hypothetical protein